MAAIFDTGTFGYPRHCQMPRPKKRTALQFLSRKRLAQLGKRFGLPVSSRSSKQDLLEVIATSTSASFIKIIKELNTAELRDICVGSQLSTTGEREALALAILGPRHEPPGSVQPCLRPFFGYYGGKWRDTPKHYPAPKYPTIIEPFAGSAGYSLRYPNKDVILVERDPTLVGIWNYLINASSSEILRLPDIKMDQSIDDLAVAQEAKWLIGFWLNRGVEAPRKRPSKWMRTGIRPGSFWGERVRRTIAEQLSYIRHWTVYEGDYTDSPNSGGATWFIDPPYQHAGQHYRFGSREIDYAQLGLWCGSRLGQAIVCENEGADWLDFKLLSTVKTTRRNRCSEVVWIQDPDRCTGAEDPRAARSAEQGL